MTKRVTSASVLHLMLVRGGCVGVREGERVLTVRSSAGQQQKSSNESTLHT